MLNFLYIKFNIVFERNIINKLFHIFKNNVFVNIFSLEFQKGYRGKTSHVDHMKFKFSLINDKQTLVQ